MAEYTEYSEASLLYADNYYLIGRLEQVFKKDQVALFQSFRRRIQEKEWMTSGEWKINISGTYFEFRYQADQGKEPFFIYLRLSPRDLANKNKEEGKEGERRSFEIALAARGDISNLGEFRKRFFERADAALREEFEVGKDYYPTRYTGQQLVKKQVEYSLPKLLDVMELEIEKLAKLTEYAKQALAS